MFVHGSEYGKQQLCRVIKTIIVQCLDGTGEDRKKQQDDDD